MKAYEIQVRSVSFQSLIGLLAHKTRLANANQLICSRPENINGNLPTDGCIKMWLKHSDHFVKNKQTKHLDEIVKVYIKVCRTVIIRIYSFPNFRDYTSFPIVDQFWMGIISKLILRTMSVM